MKINPINNIQVKTGKTANFKQNILPTKVVNQAKNILIPTTFALAMLAPIKSSAQEVLPKTTETEFVNPKNKRLPYYLQEESIQYSKDFEMDGKDYTMYYTDYCQKFSERRDAVLEIFFVPKDFELVKNGQTELNSPMKLEQLVYHNLDGKKDDFVSAIVSESTCDKNGNNYQHITKEIRLPKKIGNNLLNLYQGKTKFNLVTGVDTYTETNKDSMIEPIIQNGKKVLGF